MTCELCSNPAVEEVKFNGQYVWVCDPHAFIIQNQTPDTMYAKRLREKKE